MVVALNINADLLAYINSICVKSVANTINSLVTIFREKSTPINFVQRIENAKMMRVKLSVENANYIADQKLISKSYTLSCIIATAKELDIKLF